MLLIIYYMKIIAGRPFSSDRHLEVKNAMVQSMHCMMEYALVSLVCTMECVNCYNTTLWETVKLFIALITNLLKYIYK